MRILVAYDGSEGAQDAVDGLRSAGLPENGHATVLAVIEGRAAEDTGGRSSAAGDADATPTPDPIGACEAVAVEGAERLRTHLPGWTVTSEVRVGPAAWTIIERAEARGGADLIVLGSRGFGELKRLFFGSVVHRVLTHAACSVRIGRPRRVADGEANGEANGEADRPPRIILGDDGSPDARAALRAVAERRWPLGTRILSATFETGMQARLSNWSPNTVWGGDPLILDGATATERPAIRLAAQAAEVLKAMCPQASVTTLVRPQDPKYGLLEMAESWEGAGADCIFVGASGVRGIERFLVGSVSTAVALHAPCTVEVVHRR